MIIAISELLCNINYIFTTDAHNKGNVGPSCYDSAVYMPLIPASLNEFATSGWGVVL